MIPAYIHVYLTKQKQPRAVKKGAAKQSRIKSIEALYIVRARAQPVAK